MTGRDAAQRMLQYLGDAETASLVFGLLAQVERLSNTLETLEDHNSQLQVERDAFKGDAEALLHRNAELSAALDEPKGVDTRIVKALKVFDAMVLYMNGVAPWGWVQKVYEGKDEGVSANPGPDRRE